MTSTNPTTAETLMGYYTAKYGQPTTTQEAERIGERVGTTLLEMRDQLAARFGPKAAESWYVRQTEWLAG